MAEAAQARPATPAPRLAFAGLGGMGAGMAHRLAGSGLSLTVYNRTHAKAEPLSAAGAAVAETAAEAAAGADILFLSLSDQAAVEQVLFEQALPALRAGTLVVQTSTVSPSYARSAEARLAAAGVRHVEACVVGNPPMARSGQLRIFAAGGERDVAYLRPVLDLLGQQVSHVGATGAASAVKLAFNLLLGISTVALAEAVDFGVTAGLDRDLLITAIANSGFTSPVLAFRAEFMRQRRYTPPAFRASLMEKDLRLALGEVAEATALPVTACAAQRFADVITAGDGGKDAAVVAEHGLASLLT